MRTQRRCRHARGRRLDRINLHPYALSLNYPATVAAYNGLHNQEVYLTRQPATLPEAIRWTRWFHNRGYTVSIGLMQINSENIAKYGVTVRQLFDPCTNVAIGARFEVRSLGS